VSVLGAGLAGSATRDSRGRSAIAGTHRCDGRGINAWYERRQPAASEWDVFTHATEDKDDVVKPLACALQDLGIRVWYDEFELHLGDSLRRKTDGGLARCRFGVLVLSPWFFAKNWAQYELDSLVTREMTGEQTILPPLAQGWEGRGDLIQSSLADKLARKTSDSTVEEIAAEMAEVLGAKPSR
jgi:hypothetical protein